MTGTDDRIRRLLRAARRAEADGAHRVARALRRMAGDARPLEPGGLDGWGEEVGFLHPPGAEETGLPSIY